MINKKWMICIRNKQTGGKSMDIQKIISELIGKLTGNKDLIGRFTSDPLSVIKELLGIDLDPSQLSEVVKGVTAQLGGDVTKQAGGFFSKIKSLFGIK